ncbi:MAG: hypothetical protein ABJF04_24305 [Reichenbachiella sp.]|uniref:MBL fold metallo-hydrolase n=1 Tax=Reichenbachiella sp. TaxID=2184521 RepID=UPI00326488B6
MINAEIDSSLLKTTDFDISFSSNPRGQIFLRYLGCGGYYIGNDEDALLIDPFFSHHSFPPGKVATKTKDVAYALDPIKNDLRNKVVGVFAAHSHYDHLMDVPYVYNQYLDPDAKIYGSASADSLIGNVIGRANMVNIEPNQADTRQEGKWIPLPNTNIRVLPIATSHAPHFRLLSVPFRFYRGKAKPIKGFSSDTDKTKAGKWRVGKTFAFLIDFMEDKKVLFRIYVQSSAAPSPNGFVHDQVLNEKDIDLAILGAASFNYVKGKDYPEKLIANLKPKRIIIGHWEDFFRAYQDDPKRTVRFTNMKKFILKFNEEFEWKQNGMEMFYMPEPGLEIGLKY